MGRTPCCDKDGLNKGPWMPEEDRKLVSYIQKNGHGTWRTLPNKAGLQRCGKSCRLRWMNYLRPDIKRGQFSLDEEETIIQLHSVLGNKWSAIASQLPGRTDNEIKNYWNTYIRRRLLRMGIDPVTHNRRLHLLEPSLLLGSSLYNISQFNVSRLDSGVVLNLASTLLSAHHENLEFLKQKRHQASQLCSPQMQSPIQEIPAFTTSNAPCAQFINETQHIQANVEQFQSDPTNFSCQNSLPNILQDSADLSYFKENFVPQPNYCCYGSDQSPLETLLELENSNVLLYSNQKFSSESVLFTPSSSSTALNSSSIYVNSSTEDERDSYCSNTFKFEIPGVLDVNEFSLLNL